MGCSLNQNNQIPAVEQSWRMYMYQGSAPVAIQQTSHMLIQFCNICLKLKR